MFTTIECTSQMSATPIFIRIFWFNCAIRAHVLNDKKRKYDVSIRYRTNNILLPRIDIGQLETKILIWRTVNPKAAEGFLHSLRRWAHIAPLSSTKVFSQLATKLLGMVPVFYFPCFYGSQIWYLVLFSWSQKKADRLTISKLQSFLLSKFSPLHMHTWR